MEGRCCAETYRKTGDERRNEKVKENEEEGSTRRKRGEETDMEGKVLRCKL